jgi:hypothetical protein
MPDIVGYDATLQSVTLYGLNYPLSALDDTEQAIFDTQFETLIGCNSSVERELLEDRRAIIINGIRAIKFSLQNLAFRGINAGDQELGFGFIRPTHIKVSGSQLTKWGTSVTTSFADWWSSGTSGVGYAMSANAGMIILGLKSLTVPQPYISEIQITVDRATLITLDVRSIGLFDNKNQVPIVPLPTVYALPRQTLYSQIVGDVAGTDYIMPIGFTIANGRFLKTAGAATFIT